MVICMDGTSNNCIGTNQAQTNVVRLGRCVADVGFDGVPQQVYYHYGIGNSVNWGLNNMIEQAIGIGIDTHLLHAYHYICLNFSHPEDEIYLVGFSRGAYTAYLLGAFICRVGLLKKSGLAQMNDLHKLWRDWGYYPKGAPPPGSKYSLSLSGTQHFTEDNPLDDTIGALEKLQQIHTGVKIEACVLWDTVSALAFPAPRGIESWKCTGYEFVDKNMPQGIRNVFHALALNEKRRDFKPLIFADPPQGVTLQQCWFLGSHGNVGGGYDDFALANISLAWMIAQIAIYTGLRTTEVSSQLAPRLLELQATTEVPLGRGLLQPPSRTDQARRVADLARRDPLLFRKGKIGESYKSFFKISGAQPRAIQYLDNTRDFIRDELGFQSSPSSPSAALSDEPPNRPEEPPPAQLTTRNTLTEVDKVDIGRELKIHFTVRLILEYNYGEATCPVLSDYISVFEPASEAFHWRRKANAAKIPKNPDDMYEMMEVFEDKPSIKELALLKIWAEDEAKVLEEEYRLILKCQALVASWVEQYGELRKYDDGNLVSPGGWEELRIEDERREELGELVKRWEAQRRAWAENPALALTDRTTLAKFLKPYVWNMEQILQMGSPNPYYVHDDELQWWDEIKNDHFHNMTFSSE